MASEQIYGPVTRTRLRRLAFFWGWGVFFLFVAFAFRIGPPVSPEGPGNEQIVQRVMLGGGGLAMLLAWRWEGIGGFVLTFAAIVLGILAAIGFPPLQALLVTLLFLVPGLALIVLWSSQHQWFVMAASGALVVAGMAVGGYGATSLHHYYFGPAHPESTLVALPDSEVEWVWSGALTATSIRVNAKVSEGGTAARLAVSRNEAFGTPRWTESQAVSADTNRVVSFAVGDLEPGTEYHYAVEVDGELDLVRQASFTTPGTGPFSFTIAMGSCSRVGSNGAVFDAIREQDPLMFFALGDFHYGNIVENDIGQYRDALDAQLTSPSQSALWREAPIAYVWDDHDFGGNNSNALTPSAPAAKASYREYVPHYALEDSEAIYQAFSIGRVRFVMTDTRAERVRDTVMSDEQVEWLKQEFLLADETHALTVWVNAIPWIGEPSGSADYWAGYPEQRREISEFIAEHELDRLVMLAGDAHMLAIDDGTNSDYSLTGRGGFPIIHAAALDRPGSVKGGPYSEGSYPGAGQFATMKVEDDGGDSIRVGWQGYDWEMNEIVGLDLTFDLSTAAVAASLADAR